MYDCLIAIYALAVRFVQKFNPKARLMLNGHRQTYEILRQKIDPTADYVWFHVASLGEFEQGRPVIEELKKQHPHLKILLTFFSPSGYEVRKNYAFADVVCYLPFDLRKNVNRFFSIVRPKMAVFVKYEFWYNFLSGLHSRQIPTYLVSASFRPSQPFFKWYGGRYRQMLGFYQTICVRDDYSKDLLASIGVNHVKVCGDTRFDRVADICMQAKEQPLISRFVSDDRGNHRSTLVAGSTWSKDEEILIDYFNHRPELKLIIAPHEIDEVHLCEIEKMLQRPSVRLSNLRNDNALSCDCLIVDCFGLLASLYRYGSFAYVGGGFGVGIHNILEAAVYGIPVVFGTNYRKFMEAVELIECGGAFSVADGEQFATLADKFLSDEAILRTAGEKSVEYVKRNKSAVAKVITVLAPQLAK